jgi:hypothetical protein
MSFRVGCLPARSVIAMTDHELQLKAVAPRRWYAFALSLCFCLTAWGNVDDPLAHLRLNHPRLLFTDDQLATTLAAAKTDPLRAALNKHIVATAEHILTAPPIRQPDNDTGQEQDRYAVYDITTCAMAYRLTSDERFFARAKNDLLTVAAFPDWNPHHFLSIGEMSFAVAIGYDWLYAKLKPEERAALKRALLDKSLSFAEATYDFDNKTGKKAVWSGKNTGGNQNNVINSGLLSAALAIADEEPALARMVIAGARKSLTFAMDAYAPDGGYPEGPGYWTYATTYTAIAIAEMESALSTDLGLASSPGFDRTVNYYEAVQGPCGPPFNYADATDDLQISPARAWLAKRFHSPFALQHTRSLLVDFLHRNPITQFDRGIQGTVVNRFFALHEVWFPDEATGNIAELPLDFHFRGDADIATFRGAWNDTHAVFVGFRAGEVTDHHNHLDLGSFVLDADGQRWAMDLGPDNNQGSYTLPGYFDVKGRRWTYFRANNHSHNTVTPGDALQNRHVIAPITRFGSAPERGFAVVDLTPAYSNEVASLHRGIALLNRARVLVQDEYQPTQTNLPLHWRMVTRAKIDLSNDEHSATLTSNGKTLRADLLEPVAAKFYIGTTRPPTSAENQNDGTAILAIDLSPNTDRNITRLAVLLTPVGDKWPKLDPPKPQSLVEWK